MAREGWGPWRRFALAGAVALTTSTFLSACLAYEGSKTGRLVGSYVDVQFTGDARYVNRLGEFSTLEVWNSWSQIEPANDNWQLAGLDYWFKWVHDRGAVVRSTALIWGHDRRDDAPRGNFHPDYLRDLNATELREELKSHIQTLVRRYPYVKFWNVVNEPFVSGADGTIVLRDNIFKNKLGNDYIREALQFAYEANPSAVFVAINEFNADGMGAKADKMYAYYRDKLVGAIPSQNLAVGLQMHLDTCPGYFGNPDPDNVRKNIQRFADLGVQVHITEMDFGIRCVSGTWEHKLQVQRNKYHDITAACMAVASCRSISFWGVGDRDSWFRYYLGLNDWPLLFDDNYNKKPAYDGVVDALNGR